MQELSLNACLNGKAFLVEHGDLLEFVGNRTDCALLVLARKWGINYKKVNTHNAAANVANTHVPFIVCCYRGLHSEQLK